MRQGHSPELARTMTMNTVVVLEIFHLFFIRNIHGTSLTWTAIRGTRVIWTVVIAITLAQFAVTYLPVFQTLLGTRPVPFTDGLLVVATGVVFLALVEAEKQVRLRLFSRAGPLAPVPIAGSGSPRPDRTVAMTTLKLRLLFDGAMFGPGKADLLAHIRDTGSISAAGRRMDMSYKRAWSLVEEMNAAFATPLVTASRGGAKGGGARLTPEGEEVLTLYRRVLDAATAAAAPDIARLQSMLRPDLTT